MEITSISKKKLKGKIYTPLYIVQNILELSGYHGIEILQKHVIDNSCGDGAFLCEIVNRYCIEALKFGFSLSEISEQLSTFIHGIESDKYECEECIKNVTAVSQKYGIKNVTWDIICADTLQVHKYDGLMDYVLGNPPYVRVHNLGDCFNNIKKFSFSQKGMTDLFIIFYEVGIRMLNSTGILGYITPSSFFYSLAGNIMRKSLVDGNLIKKIVDLKHYQPFNATTYTTIVILSNRKHNNKLEYYKYDAKNKKSCYVDTLVSNNYYINNNFYFSTKKNLEMLKKIFYNKGNSDILVKNGYATLCDNVFIGNFDFKSKHLIPVIKSSKGIKSQIIYPYDKDGKLLDEKELKKDIMLYDYLLSKKDKLINRSNEKDTNKYWYAFGRSQALIDTYKNKVTINNIIRDEYDLKFIDAPAGTGVYGGLYIISDTISFSDIKNALISDEFIQYVSLLGKYKNGGYYTFSSKDIKAFLDYKFAYDGGSF